MNLARVEAYVALTKVCPDKTGGGANSDLPVSDFRIWDFFFEVLVAATITMKCLVIEPWGCLSWVGSCEISLSFRDNVAQGCWKQRWNCSYPDSRLLPVLSIGKGRRPRCSKSHVSPADPRKGYVSAVLDLLEGDEADNKSGCSHLSATVSPMQTWTADLSGFSIYFFFLFLLLLPLAARLRGGLYLLPWGGKNLIFFF